MCPLPSKGASYARFGITQRTLATPVHRLIASPERVIGINRRLQSERLLGISRCAQSSGGHLPRRTPRSTRYHGSPDPFDAEVLAEIGPPSAIAQNEFSARLRPPCAEASGVQSSASRRDCEPNSVGARCRVLCPFRRI
jgi:hypothetical protein